MSPILHALNIATLAAWLSVAGFGVTGIAVHGFSRSPLEKPKDAMDRLETIDLTSDFVAGDADSSPPSETGETSETDVPLAAQETQQTPQEMPELAKNEPLPAVPDLPSPMPGSEKSDPTPAPPHPAPKDNAKPATRSTSSAGGSARGKSGATGSAGQNGDSGESNANRLAGGRMPSPSYPSEARARGQSGTVLVEFIVGENGTVISAYAKQPSPWPILNERAISTVQRWKFAPGPVAKFTRPIVFKLN